MNVFQSHVFNIVAGIVLIASVLHAVLPPWDFLSDFPTAQKYYKLVVYVVGYIALNARSTLYKSISTQDGTTPSAAAQATPKIP
jgi:hypothetical protein